MLHVLFLFEVKIFQILKLTWKLIQGSTVVQCTFLSSLESASPTTELACGHLYVHQFGEL